MESLYLSRNLALINYTEGYWRNAEELLDSKDFKLFLNAFLDYYSQKNLENYLWLKRDLPIEEVKKDIIRLLKGLQVLTLDEVMHPYLKEKEKLVQVIEDGYHFWRNKQRYSLIYTEDKKGLQLANFIEADTYYNQMILQFYRSIQEKVQGSKNRIYRQLQAGTNASLLLSDYKINLPEEYHELNKIPFINRVMLRTPLLIHPKSTKRTGIFSECEDNPVHAFTCLKEEWFAYPCKVGGLLFYVYFHRDFTSCAIGLPNLFELAKPEDCIATKPDGIVLFGVFDKKEDTVFYHDQVNDIWVGKLSYHYRIEYFGYMKKMILTLHNLAMMEKGWLPIHGAMIELTLKNKKKCGIVLMGDSGAGKSETIEALNALAYDQIIKNEIIFDDMGSLHVENGRLYAQGTEIGAFVRLDDLEKGSAYRDMDRSIFFNPESANARVLIPTSDYETVASNHQVDYFLYANNYTDKRGIEILKNQKNAKKVFIEGKRFALGTTQEKGLSSTFFANPFGPMQKKEACLKIIDDIFDEMEKEKICIGEIYTCLGLENKGDNGIKVAAKELLRLICDSEKKRED